MSDVNAAVIYYSATGSTYAMAQAAAEAAEKAGAEVRLRKVHELAPQEAIASNEGWSAMHVRPRTSPRQPWTIWSGPMCSSSAPPRATACQRPS